MNAKPIKRSLSRSIPAPVEKVFDHWLIPTFVGKWMFNAEIQKESIVELKNEARPRGEFTYTTKRLGEKITYKGEFKIIDRPRILEFTWNEGRAGVALNTIRVLFEDAPQSTKLKISLVLDHSEKINADNIKSLWSQRTKALSTLLSK